MKVIALDFDGVLTSLNINWRRVREVASLRAGFRIESLLDFWRDNFGSKIFQDISDVVREFEERAVETAKPFEEAVKLVEEAFKRGIKVYIVSMQSRSSILRFLEKFSLLEHISGVFSREDFPTKREMLRRILQIEKIEPSELIFIDDLKRNLDECRDLGVKCVHVRDISMIAESLNSLQQEMFRRESSDLHSP
ncbi:hypothetical protein MA03_07610 [Infirmifilum uzonense]|jgi:HAD superfamily hydrolase (TIGR01509 family)|uniref:HAD family hydrolase n=1 Tax=Infirmifilum uzonense TaxID=1550241 RepID=A0A0F7FIA9_9CREN|nr:HAD-IA family hydrolase [Infirmifilum uzonense]AKG39133.1 hypothetical protein MA03_07610 [Infirmifilum uzonense]